jgi:hypothetical protein
MSFVEHRIHARSMVETIEERVARPMTQRDIEAMRLYAEMAKVYALLAIEERLGYIQNRISWLDKEV